MKIFMPVTLRHIDFISIETYGFLDTIDYCLGAIAVSYTISTINFLQRQRVKKLDCLKAGMTDNEVLIDYVRRYQ